MSKIINILKDYKEKGFELKSQFSPFFTKHTELSVGKDQELYSIIVVQKDSPEYSPKYYKTKKEKIVSRLEEEINKKMFEKNNKLNKELEEYLENKGLKIEDKNYYPEMDKRIAVLRQQLGKELEDELIKEEYFYHLLDKGMDEEEAEKKMEKINKKSKEYEFFKEKNKKPRIETKKIRYYDNQLPKEIIEFIPQGWFVWQQIYFVVDHEKKTIEYATGSYKGSGTRHSHGIYAHFFGQNYEKVVETTVYQIDKEKTYTLSLKGFVVLNQDLIGNYVIDRDESDKILRMSKRINDIEDLDFEYFISNGKRIKSSGNNLN